MVTAKLNQIAALCVGLSLIAAAVTIMVESIHEILTPHRLLAPYTLVVLAGVLIVKGLLFRHCRKHRRLDRKPGGKERRGAPSQRRDHLSLCICRHLDSSIGRARWESADDWAALCAGVFILYNTSHQMRPAILELEDAAPDPGITARVKATAARVPGVLGLDKCFVRKMGFSFYVDSSGCTTCSLRISESAILEVGLPRTRSVVDSKNGR
jgi:divalent metal cation (Fe/Co/Zn/Cd) transporter